MSVFSPRSLCSLVFLAIFAIGIFVGFRFFVFDVPLIDASSHLTELEGFAWSSNIGWISMNCSNTGTCAASDYSVDVLDNKDLSGFAWSSNIGWIQFDGLGSPPGGGGQARLNAAGNKILGWARALSNGGGWDGWIALNCEGTTDNCGTSNYGIDLGIGVVQPASYAWGGDVVGWVDFGNVNFNPPCSQALSCTHSPEGVVTTDQWCEQTTAFCTGPDICDDSGVPVCVAPPAMANGTLIANPGFARIGETTSLEWTSQDSIACRIEGSDGYSSGDFMTTISADSGSEASDPILAETVYDLSCSVDNVVFEIVDSVTVKVIPTFFET